MHSINCCPQILFWRRNLTSTSHIYRQIDMFYTSQSRAFQISYQRAPIHSTLKSARLSTYISVCAFSWSGHLSFHPFQITDIPVVRRQGQDSGGWILLAAERWTNVLGLASQVFFPKALHVWSSSQGAVSGELIPCGYRVIKTPQLVRMLGALVPTKLAGFPG